VALKNAVYVLPFRDDCLEDLQWIAEEATAGGGDARICAAEFADRETDDGLVARFRAERTADYLALADAFASTGRSAASNASSEDPASALARARRRLEEIARIDFFGAPARARVEKTLARLQSRTRPNRPPARGGRPAAALAGRTWVTRRGIQVDRIASAWLIRRFVDPKARFRFVDPAEARRAGELRFDTVDGDFTHEGDACTFETLLARTGATDPALRAIAEIVHDIDLKDGKFGRPESRGVEQVLTGLLVSNPSDEERLHRGFALFDGLYASFRGANAAPRR
jgi:hypothetical protein